MRRRHAISPGFSDHYHDIDISILKGHDSACNVILAWQRGVPCHCLTDPIREQDELPGWAILRKVLDLDHDATRALMCAAGEGLKDPMHGHDTDSDCARAVLAALLHHAGQVRCTTPARFAYCTTPARFAYFLYKALHNTDTLYIKHYTIRTLCI